MDNRCMEFLSSHFPFLYRRHEPVIHMTLTIRAAASRSRVSVFWISSTVHPGERLQRYMTDLAGRLRSDPFSSPYYERSR